MVKDVLRDKVRMKRLLKKSNRECDLLSLINVGTALVAVHFKGRTGTSPVPTNYVAFA